MYKLRKTNRFGQNESIRHQIKQWGGGVHVVKGVRCFQTPVHRMIHDGGGQGVETQEVRHFSIRLSEENKQRLSAMKTKSRHLCWNFLKATVYLHQVSVNDVLLRQKPVLHLLLVHDRHKVELAQVFPEKAVHHRHILLGHRS